MPKKILLADDSITIQKVVELTFSDGDYEVTAVNNGARAIQKLGEMRPDIILSDIIMPEKNGYEVCEYVKSHPEYRSIPVVLLTGTFEPFDPDRAEKAGCDAVVTKPFESQSLIHKVEELIAQAQAASAAAAAPPAPEPAAPSSSPWMDDAPVEPGADPSPFTTSGGSFPTPADAYTHSTDIFGAPPAQQPASEVQFDTPGDSLFDAPPTAPDYSGETKAFPSMTFDDFQQAGAEPAPPEPSPWDEPELGGETRAFGKMSFDDLQAMTPQVAPEPEPLSEPAAEAPFHAPPAVEDLSGGETRAFTRESIEELKQLAMQDAPVPPAEPEPAAAPQAGSPWDEPSASPFGEPDETPLFGGETRAFPKMSFEELQQMAAPAAEPEPEPAATTEASPWDEPPVFGGETRAIPKMSFEELAGLAPSAPEPEPPAPWEQPSEPAWSSEPQTAVEPPATESFSTADAEPFAEEEPVTAALPEDLPFASEIGQPESEEVAELPAAWTAVPAAEAVAQPEEPAAPPPALEAEAPVLPIKASDLSDEQVDRIARRVVELMSDQVVRNIAWEVIPDLAEMVVKERIRQLESEG
jgi:CheY-like chemotaxis protein